MSIILIGPKTPGNTESLGVSDAREMIRLLHLSQKAPLIIKNAERLTPEAQNALLKSLEEPPNAAEIILETTDEDLLLPTIRSRCQIIYKPRIPHTPPIPLPVFSTIPERLNFAKENALKRDVSLNFLDELLVASHDTIDPKTIRALFKAKKLLQANCNVRLVMENLFLNW